MDLAVKAASWLGFIMGLVWILYLGLKTRGDSKSQGNISLAHCDVNLLSQRFSMMAIYPPMAFGISIIAFTLQLVREKDAGNRPVCHVVTLLRSLHTFSFYASGPILHRYVCKPHQEVKSKHVALAQEPSEPDMGVQKLEQCS